MSSLASKPAAASVPLPDFAGLGFNAEFQLLLACCALRKNLDAALGLQIDRSLDWELVVRLAEHHNVMPMVYQALRDVPDRVPAKVLADLRARFEQNARKNLRLTAELLKILDCLECHGVEAVPFKGPVLAELVYGNLALREFSDLDVLVPAHDFLRAKEAVSALGYAPGWSLTKAENAPIVLRDMSARSTDLPAETCLNFSGEFSPCFTLWISNWKDCSSGRSKRILETSVYERYRRKTCCSPCRRRSQACLDPAVLAAGYCGGRAVECTRLETVMATST